MKVSREAREKLTRIMLRMEKLNSRLGVLSGKHSKLRALLQVEFEAGNLTEFVVDDEGEKLLKALMYPVTSTSYDFEKLRHRLPAETLRKIVTIVVDPKKVEAAYQTGLIKYEDIHEAADVRVSQAIKVQRVKRQV